MKKVKNCKQKAMEIKVGQEIQALLLEHGQLALAGLGTFVGEYQSATLDQLQSVIAPPQYRLRFDTNLQLDDGILSQHLRDKYALSMSQARSEVENFIHDCRISFDSRELVVLPGVGRLYLDANHRVQFLADATNFNVETFALPPVRLVPIERVLEPTFAPSQSTEKPVAKAILEQVVEKKQHERQHGLLFENVFSSDTPTRATPQLETSLDNHLPTPPPPVSEPNLATTSSQVPEVGLFTPTLVVLALLLLSFVILYIRDTQKPVEVPPIRQIEEPADQFNQPPPMPPADIPQPANGGGDAPQRQRINDTETLLQETLDTEKNRDNSTKKTNLSTQKSLIAKGNTEKIRECIVVVGVFGDATNAQRAIRSIQDFGYTVYRDKVGDATRIGCKFSYESAQELDRRVGTLRKKFGSSARILKK